MKKKSRTALIWNCSQVTSRARKKIEDLYCQQQVTVHRPFTVGANVELASYFHLKPAIQVMLSQMTRGWDRLRREIIGCVLSARLLPPPIRRRCRLPAHGWYELKGTLGFDELRTAAHAANGRQVRRWPDPLWRMADWTMDTEGSSSFFDQAIKGGVR